jgi:hypothetical protein
MGEIEQEAERRAASYDLYMKVASEPEYKDAICNKLYLFPGLREVIGAVLGRGASAHLHGHVIQGRYRGEK